MIDLRETDKEFLLFIPAPQKNRARAIEGFRWNPNRRCWVYPKTPRVYDALLAEFRDEMPRTDVPRPSELSPESLTDDYQRLVAENSRLRDEIAALKTSLAEAQERLRGMGSENGGVRSPAARAAAPKVDHQQFIAFFRALALETAGRDPHFKALLARLDEPDAFPGATREALGAAFRRRLGMAEGETALPDLVAMATLGGAITPRGADLAMAIERLGTEGVAGNPSALWARCLLALYAAALLWPELSVPGAAEPRTA